MLGLNEDFKGLHNKKIEKKILISKMVAEYAGLVCCGTGNTAHLSAIHQLVSQGKFKADGVLGMG